MLTEVSRIKVGVSMECYNGHHDECKGRVEGLWVKTSPYITKAGKTCDVRLARCICPCHEHWIRTTVDDSKYAYLHKTANLEVNHEIL